MKQQHVHIVGGGIIGLCSAWYLQKAGCEVTIVDAQDFSGGTSFGNAGMIVPSHIVPMAAPGVISQGLKWLLDDKSPFYIKPRLNVDLFKWVWQFNKSANAKHVQRSMPLLYAYNELSKNLYRELASEDCFDFGFSESGLLMLYRTASHQEEECILAEKAISVGMQAQVLDLAGLQALEPDMELDVLGGVYFPGDAHLYPNQLMSQMKTVLKTKGVTFLGKTKIVDFSTRGNTVSSLHTQSGENIPVEHVLLSSGSWTAGLLKKAGMRMLLQDGKGYSITLEKPATRPRIPTILSEAKVAITPMGNDLRIGGTLEISGLSPKLNKRRVEGILESVPKYYKNMDVPYNDETPVWKGYRPCTPDGLPYLGASPQLKNLTIGTGHGMMGLSLGPATGKLLAEHITGVETSLDISAYRLDRF
ncbi:MAG: NAD(P)/FAD-dependent oxidoreductase [Saprospiraceae bacterium]